MLLNLRAKHIAFAFNFVNLPTGIRRKLMMFAFQNVDKFVVSTKAEESVYSDYFKLDKDKLDFLPWSMDKPVFDPETPLVSGDYVCAVGGEGRDYKTLVEAFKQLDFKLVIVARPQNLLGLDLPENIQVFTNVSNANFWNIINFSRFVAVPLENENINNGHISLVGSLSLAKPIVTTLATGTQDYVTHGYTALMSKPRDVSGLKNNIELLWNDQNLRNKMSLNAESVYNKNHNVTQWVDYVKANLE